MGNFSRFVSGHNSKGSQNPNWKGGRRKFGEYWYLWIPDYHHSHKNHVREHVYFYEQFHKCCMLPWGDVHHIDENKENNMPWNLVGMMKSEHQKIHHIKDMSGRFCKYCNGKTYLNPYGLENWYGNEIDGFVCRTCYDIERKKNLQAPIINNIIK